MWDRHRVTRLVGWAFARSGAEGTRRQQCQSVATHCEERGLPMKWHAMNLYVKVTLLLSALTALLLAAGAEGKWI
ncbi:MAG: hypothetical protein OHK0015_12040 [Chloroflexi bacterium OHK40]